MLNYPWAMFTLGAASMLIVWLIYTFIYRDTTPKEPEHKEEDKP